MKRRKIKREWMEWLVVLLMVFGIMNQGDVYASASEASGTEQGVSIEGDGKEITQDVLEEIYRLWKENGMGTIEADIDEIRNFKVSGNMQASIEDYATEADVPIFMVLITDGERVVGTSAFYVRDTYGTGGTYLITNRLVTYFLEEGYEVAIVGQDYAEQITKIHQSDENSFIVCMEAEGVKKYVPLEMAEEIVYDNCGIAFLELADKEFNLDSDRLDLSNWDKSGNYFLSGKEERNFELFGAPALTGENGEVFGMFFADGEFNLLIENMIGMDFPEEAMIEQTELKQEKEPLTEENGSKKQEEMTEEQEQTGQEPSAQDGSQAKDNNSVTIVVFIATLLVLFFFISKNKKTGSEHSKKESDAKVQSGYREGTIEMKEEMQIPPTVNIVANGEEHRGANSLMPEWQLRGLSGVFEGQIFLLEHHLAIGRNPKGQIVYPQNTKGISGNHCEIRLENGNVVLFDLQSTYGTYFKNGTKIEPRVPYQLREGDCFYLADNAQAFRLERVGEHRQKLTPAVKRILRKSGPHPNVEGIYGSRQEEKLYRAGLDGKMYFGKSPNCQVVFEESDSAVSTIHCVLYKEALNLYLMDLGSVNGTFFEDGNRLRPDVPYLVKMGSSFYLASKSPEHTFVIVED